MTTTVRPESRFVDANGLRLHHLDWGNPAAPHMVCLHGFATSAHTFNGLARRFRDRFHIIACDLRGHGDSEHASAGAYGDADHYADLQARVDALGLGRFTLVGSSIGGRAAMRYAAEHPERVERLVINDIAPTYVIPTAAQAAGQAATPPSAGPRRPAEGVKRPREFASPEAALPYLRQAMPPYKNLSDDEQLEQALGLLGRRDDGMWEWKMDREPVRMARSGKLPPPADLWPVLERISCPTLVLWGQESWLLDEPRARRMAELLPHGECVMVPRAGHTPWLTEPEAIAALERLFALPL